MQIADGRKTVEGLRAEKAESVRKVDAKKKASPLASGEALPAQPGAEPAPADAVATAVPTTASDHQSPWAAHGVPLPDEDEDGKRKRSLPAETRTETEEQDSVTAALQIVEQMSDDARESFFVELEYHYDGEDGLGHRIHENDGDADVVRALVTAIGVERTRALAKKIPRLVLLAVGKEALPDCQWCEGSGLRDSGVEVDGATLKIPCACTRRKRGENTFDDIRARVERENKEQEIPKQDFSFGLEVTTKDNKVWASGVRLPTEEEAGFYIDYWARKELRQHGYSTWEDDPNNDLRRFDIKRFNEQPMMRITGGKCKALNFLHGTCGLLGSQGWRPISGGDCECKKCKRAQRDREAEARLRQQFKIAERALQAGKISQDQYDEWMNSPVGTDPEWLTALASDAP
jgi:hypothetical protein